MSRKAVRKIVSSKPYIYVFCEGESEQQYIVALKTLFQESVVLQCRKGLFDEADSLFSKDKRFREKLEIIDEIWFFFDVELSDHDKWDAWMKAVKHVQKLVKGGKKFRVRLLMTTACVEYWFLLHFKMLQPLIQTVADKKVMFDQLCEFVPLFQKGDPNSISEIAQNYSTAIENGKRTLEQLQNEGVNIAVDSAERDKALFLCKKTFTTVHEAISYLKTLPPLI